MWEAAVEQRARVMNWDELMAAAAALAHAADRTATAAAASEYGLDLLAAAEFTGLTEQQRRILVIHAEMWLTRPRWLRPELRTVLKKQLTTYRTFSLPGPARARLEGIVGEMAGIAS